MSLEAFTIADVARIHGIDILRDTGGEVYAVCPFCGDKRRKFSFIVSKGNKKNMFKCFNCGQSGSSIDLHMKLSPSIEYDGADGYKRAANDIFRLINGDQKLIHAHVEAKSRQTECVEATRLSNEEISIVYHALLRLLPLKQQHADDLIRRGLTMEDIKKFGFRSTPDDPYAVTAKLLKKGYKLEGVPGFYKTKRGKWMLSIPAAGYLCPVYDGERNLIIGFQIRVDRPIGKTKYMWVSSAGKESGVSSGAQTTFLQGEDEKTIIVTEGILKAIVIYSLLKGAVSVAGVPGTSTIKGLEAYLERYAPKALVLEAFDMDKAIRTDDPKIKEKTERIANDAQKMKDMAVSYHMPVHSLHWDADKDNYWKENYKGLDDFLLAYERKDLFIGYVQKLSKDNLQMMEFFSA